MVLGYVLRKNEDRAPYSILLIAMCKKKNQSMDATVTSNEPIPIFSI